MTAKEHYDLHLSNFYSWMCGDFTEKQGEQLHFFSSHKILPGLNKLAFDLGSGHGLQSVPLAHLGFSVRAIDFSSELLHELNGNKGDLDIQTTTSDILHYLKATSEKAELIVCMGDTLTHLESHYDVGILITEISEHLLTKGKVVLSFRDLSQELTGDQRFISVKSDDHRTLTCFLEYFERHVQVHDILHEKQNGTWKQSVSSYPKLRLNENMVTEMLNKNGLRIISTTTINRLIYLVAEKV
jgi:2-polyprenyl-3-methyl-5-hydroxy-6-metoxy-1,4-benzoquinol methylase